MLPSARTYEELRRAFAWRIPQTFNIGTAVSDAWAAREPDRVCLERYDAGGAHAALTYGALAAQSDALASALAAAGLGAGERIALLLPQSFETAIAHAAIYKLGAIAVPLALLFGVEALEYRLAVSGARAVVTNAMGAAKIAEIRAALPALERVVSIDGDDEAGAVGFERFLATGSGPFRAAETGPDTPAMMIFTSGTTGPPKGALHGHRVLLGHLPGVQMHHDFLPQPGDRLWTPADWAWAGGLLNVLLPGLYLGVPVVVTPAQKFDAETAYRIIEALGVRNAFIPPTALRMMTAVARPRERYRIDLRTLASGGESLGRASYDWAQRELGLSVNEFYGQTECNLVLSSMSALGVTRPGAIGKPVPGHEVAVIDAHGRPVAPGVAGQIAIRRPDPVMFLGYWQDPQASAAKFIGEWMTTGDQGVESEDGYISFFGRDDDVITSSGFRIGPGEIEDCLAGHPAVALAAAVGKPDPVRTEIVKAYVVLKPGHRPSEELAEEIRLWVKTRLSAHEYPREVAFVDSLPLTTTGKVIRRALRERAMAERGDQG